MKLQATDKIIRMSIVGTSYQKVDFSYKLLLGEYLWKHNHEQWMRAKVQIDGYSIVQIRIYYQCINNWIYRLSPKITIGIWVSITKEIVLQYEQSY